jgi:hypothetical protein
VQLVRQELLELKVQLVKLERRALMARQDLKVMLDLKVRKVFQALQVLSSQ